MSRLADAGPSWPADDAPPRACALCDSGRGNTGCTRPEVAGRGQPVPFDVARSSFRACGPEAFYLSFPGLYRPGEQPWVSLSKAA
jgi:hypothetical protein